METSTLVRALKRALKARGVTYAQVAAAIDMSEASVKRMFSQENFTLRRFDEICKVAGVDIADLAKAADLERQQISSLTLEQEREIVGNRKLLLVAACVLNHMTFDEIRGFYAIDDPELVGLLARLDRLRIIELLPGNRIKLLVSRTFAWLPDGPIQQFFKTQAQHEYFRSRFDGDGELMLFVNAMLSRASAEEVVEKLKRLAHEFSALHERDAALDFEKRFGHSLLLAVRPWTMQAFRELERRSPRAAQVRRNVLAK